MMTCCVSELLKKLPPITALRDGGRGRQLMVRAVMMIVECALVSRIRQNTCAGCFPVIMFICNIAHIADPCKEDTIETLAVDCARLALRLSCHQVEFIV